MAAPRRLAAAPETRRALSEEASSTGDAFAGTVRIETIAIACAAVVLLAVAVFQKRRKRKLAHRDSSSTPKLEAARGTNATFGAAYE